MMVPFILPSIFLISEGLEAKVFTEKVLPPINSVFSIKEPIQCVLVLLDNMNIIYKKITKELTRDQIVPLLLGLLENSSPQIVFKTLKILPGTFTSLDHNAIATHLFPKFEILYKNSNSLQIRVQSLVCLQNLISLMDKKMITESLIPLLKQAPLKHATVHSALVDLYEEISKKVDRVCIALDVIPELLKLAVDSASGLQVFKKISGLISCIEKKVLEEQLKYFLQLNYRIFEDNYRLEEQAKNSGDAPEDFNNLVRGNSSPEGLDLMFSDSKAPPAKNSGSMTSSSTNPPNLPSRTQTVNLGFGSIGPPTTQNNIPNKTEHNLASLTLSTDPSRTLNSLNIGSIKVPPRTSISDSNATRNQFSTLPPNISLNVSPPNNVYNQPAQNSYMNTFSSNQFNPQINQIPLVPSNNLMGGGFSNCNNNNSFPLNMSSNMYPTKAGFENKDFTGNLGKKNENFVDFDPFK
jgi:hypothetical protein